MENIKYPIYIVDSDYNVLFYISEDGVYKREGSCKMCGRCCVAFSVDNLGKDGMCKYLKDNKCILQEKGLKPVQCRLSPRWPFEAVDENCGYRWVKLEGGIDDIFKTRFDN